MDTETTLTTPEESTQQPLQFSIADSKFAAALDKAMEGSEPDDAKTTPTATDRSSEENPKGSEAPEGAQDTPKGEDQDTDYSIPDEIANKSEKTREHWKNLEASKRAESERAKVAEEKLKALQEEFESLKRDEKPTVDPEELTSLKTKLTEYEDEIGRLNLERHPKFRDKFEGGLEKAVKEVASIVGKELEGVAEQILRAPDSPARREAVSNLFDQLNQYEQAEFMSVLRDVRKLEAEKEDVRARFRENLERFKAEDAEQSRLVEAARDREAKSIYNEILRVAQDKEKGLDAFREIEGDDTHNKGVASNLEAINNLLFGEPSQQEIVQAAFWAQAGKEYITKREPLLVEKIARLESKIASMAEVSSPSKGATGSGEGASTASEPKNFAERVVSLMES